MAYQVKSHISVHNGLDIPQLTKSGSGVTFVVMSDGRKVGTLTVGSGSVTWQRHKRKEKLNWDQFGKRLLD